MPRRTIHARRPAEGTLRQRHQGERTTLAVVVGAHENDHVFQRDDENQRPEDQRENAEDGRFVNDARAAVRGGHRFTERIERARSDVAVDDTDAADCQRPESGLFAMMTVAIGLYQASFGGRRRLGHDLNRCCAAISQR